MHGTENRIVASYANLYLATNAVIAPTFGLPDHDEAAHKVLQSHPRTHAALTGCTALHCTLPIHVSPCSLSCLAQILRSVFPTREVVPIQRAKEIVKGGGGIHCITMQQAKPVASANNAAPAPYHTIAELPSRYYKRLGDLLRHHSSAAEA